MLRSWKTLPIGLMLMLAIPVVSGCLPVPVDGRCRELSRPPAMTVRQGTLLRLDGGWEVGLQMVYWGEYIDAAGQSRDGLLARISVWDGQAPQAATLVVHEGSEFAAGGRWQVVMLAAGRAARLPGTADGAVTLERLL